MSIENLALMLIFI